MADKRILINEGLFVDPSVPQESVPASDEDSILDTDNEGEITSTQGQLPDPQKAPRRTTAQTFTKKTNTEKCQRP